MQTGLKVQGGVSVMSSVNSLYSTGSFYGVKSGFFDSFTSGKTASESKFYSDYSGISNGSYYKLMKTYYNGNSATDKVTSGIGKGSNILTAADKINSLKLRDEASSLKKTASKLLAFGTESLFRKTVTSGEDGVTKEVYDTDKIFKAVSAFADSYNNLVDSASDSSATAVLTTAASMTGLTQANEKALASVGITVGADNTISIDEEEFKTSDMGKVKSLFGGTGSYGYQISGKASAIYNQTVSQITKFSAGSTYSGTGMSGSSYSGSVFNKFL